MPFKFVVAVFPSTRPVFWRLPFLISSINEPKIMVEIMVRPFVGWSWMGHRGSLCGAQTSMRSLHCAHCVTFDMWRWARIVKTIMHRCTQNTKQQQTCLEYRTIKNVYTMTITTSHVNNIFKCICVNCQIFKRVWNDDDVTSAGAGERCWTSNIRLNRTK